MTLDSFLPPELLLPSPEPDSSTSQETVQIGARFLEGHYEKGTFCISRVISTNPRDYLGGQYTPGSRIVCSLPDKESSQESG